MKVNAFLNFSGQCEAAFRHYERCLGAKLFMMTWGESPMADQAPAEWRGKLLHATLTVGDAVLMGCDNPPGQQEPFKGFVVSVELPDVAACDRVFAALSDGGTIQMPLQQTFWTLRFGMLTDRFGVPWMINCEQQPAA